MTTVTTSTTRGSVIGASTIASGCLLYFGLPFVIGGAVFVLAGLFGMAGGEATSRSLLALMGGMAFLAVGLGLVLAARYGKRQIVEVERLKAEYPDSPWMWDIEWASGTMRSAERGIVVFIWILAVAWNGVAAPMLVFLPGELRSGNYAALAGLILPVVGLVLLIWAIRVTARWRRFGVSELALARNPVPVGGEFVGAIRARFDTPPQQMTVGLYCIRRVSGHSSAGMNETVVWQQETAVPPDAMGRDASGMVIPFRFDIPGDAPPTDREGSPVSIRWRLRAEADVKGVDYASRFEVPVFRIADGLAGRVPDTLPAEAPGDDLPDTVTVEPQAGRTPDAVPATSSGYPVSDTLWPFASSERRLAGGTDAMGEDAGLFDPARATVQVSPAPAGGTEFRFGAARAPGLTLTLAITTAVFIGAAWGLRRTDAPVLFPGLFALIGLALLVITTDLWLVVTIVVIGSDGVTIRNTVLGVGGSRHVELADIEDVRVRVGLSQTEAAMQSARAWHDISLRLSGGRTVSAGRHLTDRKEAEWVASQMRSLLGLDRGSRD